MGRGVEGRRGRLASAIVLPSLLNCLSCGSADHGSTGTLEAAWTGAESGSVRTTAVALWCPERRFAEILGVHGDTGVAIALRELDSIRPGRYAAVLPDSADTAGPSATVALRFLSRTSITGFRSDSGDVTVTRARDGSLGVEFRVRARAPEAAARIGLRGRAAAVPIRDGGIDCAAGQRGE
jgi:hypothetical protein